MASMKDLRVTIAFYYDGTKIVPSNENVSLLLNLYAHTDVAAHQRTVPFNVSRLGTHKGKITLVIPVPTDTRRDVGKIHIYWVNAGRNNQKEAIGSITLAKVDSSWFSSEAENRAFYCDKIPKPDSPRRRPTPTPRPNTQGRTQSDEPTTQAQASGCGWQYGREVRVTRYGGTYGPVYFGSTKLNDSEQFKQILQNGSSIIQNARVRAIFEAKPLTDEVAQIVAAMSENEGNIEAVQSYDSEAITAGAMQKTVNRTGTGELPIQIKKFRELYPEDFANLFTNCGWSVEGSNQNTKLYYSHRTLTNGQRHTGEDLKDTCRTDYNTSDNSRPRPLRPRPPNLPIGSMIAAISHPHYVILQILDFIDRLYTSNAKVNNTFKTALGKAVVLDHDVNRPGHVARGFNEAVRRYEEQARRRVANWPTDIEERKFLELALLDIYGPLRGNTTVFPRQPMTDATNRYNALKRKLPIR